MAHRGAVGGPVGSGKTALVEQLVPRLLPRGLETIVVTNDIVTTEDAEHVRWTLAGGDKIPRKRGPGLIRNDLLVINKTDLAPYVGASLDVMARDSHIQCEGRPFLFANCRDGEGIEAVVDAILAGVPVPA